MSRWTERVAIAALLLTSGALTFEMVDRFNAHLAITGLQTTVFETALDAHIPFVPAFAFIYVLYYPWLLLPLPILRERKHFYHCVAAFIAVEIAASIVFVAFPSHMMRPTVTGQGLSIALTQWVYKVDPGWNLVPSLHVAHTLLVALFFRQLSPKAFPLVALGTALIWLSTVLVKQHYVIDIPFGALFGLLAYWVTRPVGDYVGALERARYANLSRAEHR